MRVQPRNWLLPAILLLPGTSAISAQQTVQLGTVITTFLADTGVPSRVVPWTIGSRLPVTWQSGRPVKTDAEGYTLGLNGTVQVALEGHAPVPVTIQLLGNNDGIERVTLAFDWTNPDLDVVEKTLETQGVHLTPLRCNRKTEPKAAGNVLFEARAAGKTSLGVEEAWSCAPAGTCSLGMSLLYRRNDVDTFHCMAPA